MPSFQSFHRSASGRQFVCANQQYLKALEELGEESHRELKLLIANVTFEGQLLELLEISGDWGYGAPLVYTSINGRFPHPGRRGAPGAFRLDWVRGLFLRFTREKGPQRVELESGHLRDFSSEKPKGFYGRFEAICRRKTLERVRHLWEAPDHASDPEEISVKVQEALKELENQSQEVLQPCEHEKGARLAEAVLEDIIRANCEDPTPPPGLAKGGASSQSSSSEAHDADDDEGRSRPARRPGRGTRGYRRPKHRGGGASPETFADSAHDADAQVPSPRNGRPRRPLWSLLQANRTGKLQALLENLRREQQDMPSDLQALKERFEELQSASGELQSNELPSVAEKLASEVERRADDFQRLKERALESLLRMKRQGKLDRLAQEMRANVTEHQAVEDHSQRPPVPAKQRALQSLLEMKRSGELQLLAEEMDSAQKKFEAKAAQFREISAKMRRGMMNAMRNGELERLVGEMTEVLETQAESIRSRVRKGMLRAHRRGELQDLRQEFDELADEVPSMTFPPASVKPRRPGEGSDSDEAKKKEEDLSSNEGSDAEKSAPALSSWQPKAGLAGQNHHLFDGF
ncbi:unnamed protein product [Durusdinium trenchii]|uniref:Uncharacterized protein n=1 Tax=Durusdinium trenchii TaxID=1381693 RepID=A0ABP0RMJ2_9DINO